MTTSICGVLLQIEDAVSLSTREWTLAALALFFLFVSWIGFVMVIRRVFALWREDVGKLVTSRDLSEQGWRTDLQEQIKKRGVDAERVEQGLASAASAVRDQAKAIDGIGLRIGELEGRCEAIDRRTEALFQRRGPAGVDG